jgi:5-hydroxyisourate hydrolase
MSGISTHVLDTAVGKPAEGVPVRLYFQDQEVGAGVTSRDGRCADLLQGGAKLKTGVYRIIFEIAEKFPDSFYPRVEISFRITDSGAHYHVPLLLSPFGYTTYRGS